MLPNLFSSSKTQAQVENFFLINCGLLPSCKPHGVFCKVYICSLGLIHVEQVLATQVLDRMHNYLTTKHDQTIELERTSHSQCSSSSRMHDDKLTLLQIDALLGSDPVGFTTFHDIIS